MAGAAAAAPCAPGGASAGAATGPRGALQEFGEDVSAAVSAAGARASGALLGGFSALRLGAAAVASSVTFRRAEARGAAADAAGAESRTEAELEADGARVDSAAQGVAGATAVWRAPAGCWRTGPGGQGQRACQGLFRVNTRLARRRSRMPRRPPVAARAGSAVQHCCLARSCCQRALTAGVWA
jgi:hypothetical protein